MTKPETVSLPKLSEHKPYAELLARHAKLSEELRAVAREKSALDFKGPALSDVELEAMRLATGETDAEAKAERRKAGRYTELCQREEVLRKAVEILGAKVEEAKSQAQRELARRVFEQTWRPAVREAGEQLLQAVRSMLLLRRLQNKIGSAGLDSGPCGVQPLPVYDCDERLQWANLLAALCEGGFMSDAEAGKWRETFAAL